LTESIDSIGLPPPEDTSVVTIDTPELIVSPELDFRLPINANLLILLPDSPLVMI